MIITASLWLAFACCAALVLSGCARMARTDGGWRDAGCWHGPLIFASASLALLTAAGAVAPAAGVLLAAVPLAVIAVRASRVWRAAVKGGMGKGGATRLVASLLRGRVRDALWNAREDLRDLAGTARPQRAEAAAPARTGAPPARRVPPLRDGPAPAPAEVAEGLAAAGVAPPGAWARVAEDIGDFEASDEDDLMAFMAETAAGILAVADAWFFFAENLGDGAQLDPAYILGLFDLGDEFAGLAAAAVLAHRRYHDVYSGVHEHVDSGATLPADARAWFGAEGGAAA